MFCIPHFYRAFYVYQYATGYSAAVAFSRRVLSGDEKKRDQYLNFSLRLGDLEHQRAGLHSSVGFSAFEIRHAGVCGNIAVAC